jgi:hypothetical protein
MFNLCPAGCRWRPWGTSRALGGQVGGEAGGGRGLVEMKAAPSVTIRQIEFELEKAEHGMGMPYDAERVGTAGAGGGEVMKHAK